MDIILYRKDPQKRNEDKDIMDIGLDDFSALMGWATFHRADVIQFIDDGENCNRKLLKHRDGNTPRMIQPMGEYLYD